MSTTSRSLALAFAFRLSYAHQAYRASCASCLSLVLWCLAATRRKQVAAGTHDFAFVGCRGYVAAVRTRHTVLRASHPCHRCLGAWNAAYLRRYCIRTVARQLGRKRVSFVNRCKPPRCRAPVRGRQLSRSYTHVYCRINLIFAGSARCPVPRLRVRCLSRLHCGHARGSAPGVPSFVCLIRVTVA